MGRIASYKGIGSPMFAAEILTANTTAITLTLEQQGKLLLVDGTTGSTTEIKLPQPEAGMQYMFLFTTGGGGAATKIISTFGDSDILHANTTYNAVVAPSSAETGVCLWFIGMSDTRWASFQLGDNTSAADTTGATS